jgi:hypothetical protein
MAKSCTTCAKGTYQNSTGKTSCDVCPRGRFGRSTGLKECTKAPSGVFCPLERTTSIESCQVCPPGRYGNTTEGKKLTEACDDCPEGHGLLANWYAHSVADCQKCPKGTYSSKGEVCDHCLPNTYSDDVGLGACKQCSPGTCAPMLAAHECKAEWCFGGCASISTEL